MKDSRFDDSDGGCWLAKIEDLLLLADEVRYDHPAAEDFCEGVAGEGGEGKREGTLRAIKRKIERYGLPTDGQKRVIRNIERGLRRWINKRRR